MCRFKTFQTLKHSKHAGDVKHGEKLPGIRIMIRDSHLPVKRLLEIRSDANDDIVPTSEGMEPARNDRDNNGDCDDGTAF